MLSANKERDNVINKEKQMIYQLHASLKWSPIKIWRRFLCESDTTLTKLMKDLLVMFNMDGSHLYSISTRDNSMRFTPSKMLDPDFRDLNADKYKISDVLVNVKDKIDFEYDYGDSWLVEIKLEKVFEDVDYPKLPWIIKAKGFGIIEDIGGVDGLAEALDIFKRLDEEYADENSDDEDFEDEDFNDLEEDIPEYYRELYYAYEDVDFEECDVEELNDIIGKPRKSK